MRSMVEGACRASQSGIEAADAPSTTLRAVPLPRLRQGRIYPTGRRSKIAFPIVLALLLAGCGARDCLLGIAHRDCVPEGSPYAEFPQDDAICRSYGLVPGTNAYYVCRHTKKSERRLTGLNTDYGVLKEPLLPDLR